MESPVTDDLQRLSLNQITTRDWTLPEAVAGCERAGIPWIGLWRDKVADVGLDEAARLLDRSDVAVSSLCRAGFFPSEDQAAFEEQVADGERAIEEARRLGTDVLVLVCGGMVGRDLAGARRAVAEGIDRMVPTAQREGVRLAIEPLHPMYCADRSVIVTLDQAVQLAEQFPADDVGVVVDTFHVWWDPAVLGAIERARGRVLSFQVCDWLVPLPDVLLGRGMMGDGPIDFRALRDAVDATGYDGPIEVEIFNQEIWERPGDEVVDEMVERFVRHVA